jgi:hypothetical protein
MIVKSSIAERGNNEVSIREASVVRLTVCQDLLVDDTMSYP